MSAPEIHDGVSRLAAALEGATLDDSDRAELLALREVLDAALAGESGAHGEATGLLDQAMAKLEGEHPELTAALGRIAETLSEIGI